LSLAPGARLGPYEIVAALGAGGMGEVYRARDTRLGRDVAVKVLPVHLGGSPERRERFEREARAVAALSHPNILALHDVGREGETAYVVTELLEGATLRERLRDGPLPVRKATEYAAQVALGLAAAHAQGIVHRDLKPDNVFVTRDGQVKILDFGLARQIKEVLASGTETSSPTLQHATEAGAVLGTVGYMSPEQARGGEADARSDIFAFGCLLREMLTGRRAFERGSAAETLAAIIREEPEPLGAALPDVPPALERIVTHCLEKSPDERFQSARDLAFDLQSLSGSSAVSGPGPGAPRLVSRRWLGWAVGGLAVALAFVAGRSSRRDTVPTGAPERASFTLVTDQPGVESDPALAPDGKSVVYVAEANGQYDLFLLRVGGRNPTPLTADSPVDDWQPVFSPDGERIAFRSEREGGGIFLMDPTGESVRRVSDFGFDPSFSPDGREIVVGTVGFQFPMERSGRGSLWAVDVGNGGKREIVHPSDAVQPAWSPHGKRIAYWGLRRDSGQRDIFTVAADGSELDSGGVAVTDDAPLDWSPMWAPDGRHLYFGSNRGGTMSLWRVAIDEATGRTLSPPEPLTLPTLWSGRYSLSRDGKRIAFESLDWRSTLHRQAFDPAAERTVGAALSVFQSTGRPIRDHRISPDGQWVVFSRSGVQEDLFLTRMDGGQYRRLTDDAFRDRGPSFSPDGQRIAFYSDRSGAYEHWTIRPDGSGLEQLTRRKEGSSNFPVWSPDGKRIAAAVIPQGWALYDLTGPRGQAAPVAQPELDATHRFWPMTWTADGRRIAGPLQMGNGLTDGVAQFDLATGRFARVFESAPMAWLIPAWLADGRRLLVRDRTGIRLVDAATGRTKPLVAVSGYYVGYSLDVTRDDRWITYTETATDGDVWLATLE
jgi:eukaryotic-like serine/threonine-protein kinase